MRIMILGAGGVGGYLASRLILNKEHELCVVARGEHLKAIQKHGLRVIDDLQQYTLYPIHATDDPSNLGVFDLIIITLKENDFESGLQLIKNNVGAKTITLSLLNGVEYRPRILKRYPFVDALEGCIYILSNIIEPGLIQKKGKVFQLCWGKEGFNASEYRSILELFDRCLPRHKATNQIAYEQWKKFLFISPMALLSSYYNAPMDKIAQEHSDELRELIKEMLSIANAKGVNLGGQELKNTLSQASKIPPGAKTSMQLDFERGKPAELDALGGYVIDEAKRLKIDTPLTNEIYNALKCSKNSKEPIS